MPRLAVLLCSFLGMLALLCYLAYQSAVPRKGATARPISTPVSSPSGWVPLIDSLPLDTLPADLRAQVLQQMRDDYRALCMDTLPPVVAHEAFAPTDCEPCWLGGTYAPVVDLKTLALRFEAMWGLDATGRPGLEVRCFVPRAANLEPASLSYHLHSVSWVDTNTVGWNTGLEPAVLLPHRVYDTVASRSAQWPGFEPLAATVVVPDSEVVYRYFHPLDTALAEVPPRDGTVEVVLSQHPFVQVATFEREAVGDTVHRPYGTVRLLDWDGRRVYLDSRLVDQWDQLFLFPMDAQGRVLLPEEPAERFPLYKGMHSADYVHPHQYAFFEYHPTHTWKDYQRLLYPHYKQDALTPKVGYAYQKLLRRYTLSLPAERIGLYLRYPLDNTVTRSVILR